MKLVSVALASFGQADIRNLEATGKASLMLDNEVVEIELAEVDIQSEDVPGWMVAGKNALTVALDITITPELEQEGNARELVNRIQKIRKDSGYELTDRVLVKMTKNDKLVQSITQFNNYICAEILADRLELIPDFTGGIDIEVNEIPLRVMVEKKG
jgi:isoleucyl-tRNA synthetase